MTDQAGAHTSGDYRADGLEISSDFGVVATCHSGSIPYDQALENAKLLANAPAMAEELARLRAHVAATRQEALDEAWRAVDAQGGMFNVGDAYDDGYDVALSVACAAIERLGGRDSSVGIYAEVAKLRAEKMQLVEALKKAEQFIVNGCELGFIRMPKFTDDPSHQMLPEIRADILAAEGK